MLGFVPVHTIFCICGRFISFILSWSNSSKCSLRFTMWDPKHSKRGEHELVFRKTQRTIDSKFFSSAGCSPHGDNCSMQVSARLRACATHRPSGRIRGLRGQARWEILFHHSGLRASAQPSAFHKTKSPTNFRPSHKKPRLCVVIHAPMVLQFCP